jgi:hypothetical protein
MRAFAEDLRVRVEAHRGAAPVRRLAAFSSGPCGMPREKVWR